jgi:hypothetical protein
MTDQRDEPIRSFLAEEAVRRAVDAPTMDEAVTRVAMRLGKRDTVGPTRQMAILVAATLLLVATLSVATAVGSGVLRLPFIETIDTPPVIGPTGYEAVFLQGAIRDGEQFVTVIGIDAEGGERVIADVTGGVEFGIDGPYVVGAVSRHGVLALATGTFGHVRWELHDLRSPGSAPIAVPDISQDVEQLQATPYFSRQMRPSVFWGPTDTVAIPWYLRVPDPAGSSSSSLDWWVTFVNESGTASTVDVPDSRWRLLPEWAGDGSGVLLGSPIGASVTAHAVLRPDGSITEVDDVTGSFPACRSIARSGSTAAASVEPGIGPVEYVCLSPDDERVAFGIGVGAGNGEVTATRSISGLAAPGSENWLRVGGKFAGWMEEVP